MRYQPPIFETATVTFSPFEGRQLLESLEQLDDPASLGLDAEILDAASEKLGDANALARWLGESVILELRPDEAHQLLEALETTLQPAHRPSAQVHTTLSTARDKLQASQPPQLVAET